MISNISSFPEWKTYFNNKNLPDVYAVCLYAQAIHETGRFTSNLMAEAKNLFGMRPSTRTDNYVGIHTTPNNGNFSIYSSYEKSIDDRIALDVQNRVDLVNNINDIQEFMTVVLSNGYVPQHERADYFDAWFSYITETIEQNRNIIYSVPNDELEENLLLGNFGPSSNNIPSFLTNLPKWLIALIIGGVGLFGWIKYKK